MGLCVSSRSASHRSSQSADIHIAGEPRCTRASLWVHQFFPTYRQERFYQSMAVMLLYALNHPLSPLRATKLNRISEKKLKL